MTPKHKVLARLEAISRELQAITQPTETAWEWDDWFQMVLLVISAEEYERLAGRLQELLPHHWTQDHTNDENHWTHHVSSRSGGLAHGQSLLTSEGALGEPLILLSIWPWGDQQQVSLRAGVFIPPLWEGEEGELRAKLRDWFQT